MKPTLNEKTKAFLEKELGMKIEELEKKDAFELDQMVENRINKKLSYVNQIRNQIGRGNVYLYLGRFLNINSANKRIAKI
jgi:hypothetical protein